MRIVVTHLTRMRAPFICAAGIDLSTGDHVRPVLERDQLGRSLLTEHGGPFEIGAIVELDPVRHVGRAPEIEDWRFERRKARRVRSLPPDEVWYWLSLAARARLGDIFGDDLRRHGDTYITDLDRGQASLGCLEPVEAPLLMVNAHGRIRLRLREDGQTAWLPVTDLRLYEADQATPRREVVERLAGEIADGARVMLCVGLTRPYLKPGDDVERHWLQVNNIHIHARDACRQRGKPSVDERARPVEQGRGESARPSRAVAIASPVPTARKDGADHPAIPWLDIDQAIQQTILSCRDTLPRDSQTAENIADEIARRVHLALNLNPIEEAPSNGERQIQWQERLNKMRATYAKAYMPWTRVDDSILEEEFMEGAPVGELATRLERHPGAISARLKKLSLID